VGSVTARANADRDQERRGEVWEWATHDVFHTHSGRDCFPLGFIGVDTGLRWGDFATEAGAVARGISDLIEKHGFALMGTIRRDGSPRISAVETHLVADDLVLIIIPKSRKADDIRRDGRVTLQSPISSAGNPGSEYKLRGRAVPIRDEHERVAVADAVEERSGWRPRAAWLSVGVIISHASHTVWQDDGSAEMMAWSSKSGATTKHLVLDMDAGGYRMIRED
jgi:hypothetical protein